MEMEKRIILGKLKLYEAASINSVDEDFWSIISGKQKNYRLAREM